MRALLAALVLVLVATSAEARLKVYGSARDATGGEGKPALLVNLPDGDLASDGFCTSVHCSIRDALAVCKSQGGATVGFTFGGSITLSNALLWDCSFSTIDGATAPAGGVQFIGHAIQIAAVNVIFTQFRLRASGAANRDCIAILSGGLIVLDHLSFAGCRDGSVDLGDGPAGSVIESVTVQFCLLAENLGSGAMLIASGTRGPVTLWGNAWVSNLNRAPNLQQNEIRDGTGSYLQVWMGASFWYNAVYLTEVRPGVTGTTPEQVMVELSGNGLIFQRGPDQGDTQEKFPVLLRDTGVYAGRAILHLMNTTMLPDSLGQNWSGYAGAQYDAASLESAGAAGSWPTTAPSLCDEVVEAACATRRTESSLPADLRPAVLPTKAEILAGAGATKPCRDAMDTAILAYVNAQTGPSLPMTAMSQPLPDLARGCN